MGGIIHTSFSGRRRCLVVAVTALALVALDGFRHSAQADLADLAALAKPALSNQASSSGYPVGSSIFDSAMLGMGINPTGTITFRLYGPSDPTCAAAPIFTWNTTVLGNGYYTSGNYLANVAGTYRWTAAYNGDLINKPTAPTPCGEPSGAVTVAKRSPMLSGRAGLASPTGPTFDTATLNGGGPTGPGGTLTFALYGPDNLVCAGAPIFKTSSAVAGNGSYTSASFTPTASGTYQWVVNYSGDANNNAAGTICTDPANAVTVTTSTTTTVVALTVTPATVQPAGQLTVTWSGIARPTPGDWVALYAVGAPDYLVRTWRYTTGTASGSTTLTVPGGTPPGSYEVRLYANNSTLRLAQAPVTVS